MTMYEVGPRDGLQHAAALVPASEKVAFVDLLSEAGLPVIEVSAFVSPKWVPQMADASEVFTGISKRDHIRYTALVPNERVAELSERLIQMGVFEVAVSDTIGIAHPAQVKQVLEAVLSRVPIEKVALHFHDTRGTALANVLEA